MRLSSSRMSTEIGRGAALLVTHPASLLGISLLLGQDPSSQVPHPCVGVLEEPVELRPTFARDEEAVVQEAFDVALALAVLELFRGKARAIAAEVAGMVAAGEALARPPAPAAPAVMTPLLTGHRTYGTQNPPSVRSTAERRGHDPGSSQQHHELWTARARGPLVEYKVAWPVRAPGRPLPNSSRAEPPVEEHCGERGSRRDAP
jgi:hypothetical protein